MVRIRAPAALCGSRLPRVISALLPLAKVRLPATTIRPLNWPRRKPSAHAPRGVRRLVQLALLKVAEEREQAASLLGLSGEAVALGSALGVTSVSGVVMVSGAALTLDGDEACVVGTRAGSVRDAGPPKNAELVFGLNCSAAPKEVRPQLESLLGLAGVAEPGPLARRTVGDLSAAEESLVLARAAKSVPLPRGWLFNGSAFVDFEGRRQPSRPDKEALLADFVAAENSKLSFWSAA